MADTLPYKVKVSDGGQNCTRCNKKIEKEKLQLARMMQSPTEDKIIPEWFDIDCFFKAVRPKSELYFDNFANLDNTQKSQIRKRIDIANGKKGVKRAAKNVSPVSSAPPPPIDSFAVQYSRLGKNVCGCCFKPIAKGKMEMKKIISGTGLAESNLWYHLDCFKRQSSNLGWHGEADAVPGFRKLKRNDQELLKKKMESKDDNNNEPAAKKHKTGSLDDVNAIIEKKIASQNKELHHWKNTLKNLKQQVLIEILETNNQFVPKENEDILMHVADMIYFGALQPCDKCTNGKFMFGNSSYKCMGYSNYAKCNNVVKEPKRTAVKMPQHIKDAHYFLKGKFNVRTRAIKIISSNLLTNTDQPLFDMEFSIIGNLEKTHKEIKDIIEKLGGRMTSLFLDKKKTAAVISRVEEVRKDEKFMKPHMKSAKQLGIQVVPEDFLDAVKSADPFVLIKDMNLSTWECIDPAKRLTRNGVIISKSDSFYDEATSKVQTWKNGVVAVDEECQLENAHVYHGIVHGRFKFFTASMTLVDIVLNKNSYQLIQLIESDDKKRYWIFEKHGRISTKIRHKTQTEYEAKDVAMSKFKERFQELTGNEFCDFAFFDKKPGKYQLMDIVHDKQIQVLDNLVESKLKPPVYELMKLICDEKAMQETMLRFEIDTATMPLGKIGKSQIKEAQRALERLSRLVRKKRPESDLIEQSNRFYTMIPHKYILKPPPIINTTEMIASKMEMLERLREIEFTYSLLNETNNTKNPLDSLYHKLDAEISPLNRNSIEYGQITRYVQQTQHQNEHHSAIEVLDILEVVRRGEEARFKPFKNFKNRTLLWHGSCLTNFIGILSTGLKLSPPADVEINGNAFGNGIYFADSVSKSAMYCNASKKDEALLLLCEVALGEIHEILGMYADMNSRLTPPKGIHSVKAIGQRRSPSQITRTDGVLMPDGIVIQLNCPNQIQFNEYIVHNEAQIRIRYLVKVKLLGYENYDDEDDYDDDDDDDDGEYSSTNDSDVGFVDTDSDEIIEISD